VINILIKSKVESYQNGGANEIEDLGKSISWDYKLPLIKWLPRNWSQKFDLPKC
jgi:hypothetical protein